MACNIGDDPTDESLGDVTWNSMGEQMQTAVTQPVCGHGIAEVLRYVSQHSRFSPSASGSCLYRPGWSDVSTIAQSPPAVGGEDDASVAPLAWEAVKGEDLAGPPGCYGMRGFQLPETPDLLVVQMLNHCGVVRALDEK